MKRLLTVSLLAFGAGIFAQEKASVEKSLTGIQVGLFGAELYNEVRLSDRFLLRSQIALYPSIWGGEMYNKTGFALAPALSLSPKFYYNLDKRLEMNKNIKNNSGNYVSVKIEYMPDLFVISNVNGIEVQPTFAIIPHWGLRKNFADNFNYEFRAGLGIAKVSQRHGMIAQPELSFKIGYDF